jgi:NADPH-dependent stearoyl-CoA 9-desaturase
MNRHAYLSLDVETLAKIEEELNTIVREETATLGAEDRAYILRMIRIQRSLGVAGRAAILASLPLAMTPAFVPVLGLGASMLGFAKILENMEIGHNVLHGQWDWMNDPQISSRTWDWDNVCPSDQWRHSHNVVHHTWTNVMGRDRDVGYEILRISERQPWEPRYLLQPVYNTLLAFFFQWGIAVGCRSHFVAQFHTVA